jgi:hypothetical protein
MAEIDQQGKSDFVMNELMPGMKGRPIPPEEMVLRPNQVQEFVGAVQTKWGEASAVLTRALFSSVFRKVK